MGVVYKARQVHLKRIVALKTIRSGTQAEEEELSRFRTEAEAVARLHHPNIVQIHEIGEHRRLWFISLEFVEGGTLAAKVKKGALPPHEAAGVVEILARAMHHAHERGIIHRDLKPANVLLTADGTPKITDFGLAKQLEADSGQTRTGAIMGTPSYMAPEQASGQVELFGPLVDVYALGAILYELLAGQPPFRGKSVLDTLEMVRSQEPLAPSRLRPGIPRDLETICLKAISKQGGQRYGSALALANDLARFRAGEPILARRESLLARGVRFVKRHRSRLLLAAGILLALGLASYLFLTARHTSEASRLDNELSAELAVEDWTPSQAQKVEELADRLGKLDPELGKSARSRIDERLAGAIKSRIWRGTLQDQEIARLRDLVAHLGRRDAGAASALTKELQDRVRRWQTVLKLEPPFAEAAKAFGPTIAATGKVLRFANPSRDPDPLLVSTVPSPGNADIRAVFADPDWRNRGAFGLALHADRGKGYLFLVEPGTRAMPAEAGKGGTTNLKVLLKRNGKILREYQWTSGSAKPLGPLALQARREGNQLTFRIQEGEPITFIDPFPLRSDEARHFGLVIPSGMGILTLQADLQTLPPQPSLLERADRLHEEGAYAEALNAYRSQALTEGTTSLGKEVRYKEALCLSALKRPTEAEAVLRELALEGDRHWAVLSCCRLWKMYLERQDLAQAELVKNQLLTLGLDDGSLARILPTEVLALLRGSGARETMRDFLLTPTKEMFERARRDHGLYRALARDPVDSAAIRFNQGVTYRLADRDDLALPILREALADFIALGRDSEIFRLGLRQIVWIHLHRGDPQGALEDIDGFLAKGASLPELQRNSDILRIERARVLAALKRYGEAEAELDAATALLKNERAYYLFLVQEALLVKGFLRHLQGDEQGAQQAWREGRSLFPKGIDRKVIGSSGPLLLHFMLGGLTQTLGEEEIREIPAFLLGGGEEANAIIAPGLSVVPADVFRGMWRTSRGLDVARRLALRECSYLESGRLPAYLTAYETFRQSALTGPPSSEQDNLLWRTLEVAHADFLKGKVGPGSLTPLFFLYKGQNVFGAFGIPNDFAPETRAHLGYLLGMRYLRLAGTQGAGRRTEAVAFFRTALKTAEPGSMLQRELAKELAKLK